MNMKQNIYIRAGFTLFVLLAALWLPSVSIACDFSVNKVHQLNERSDGFAETDPAIGQSQHQIIVTRATNNQFVRAVVGFAETDPAAKSSKPAEVANHYLAQTITAEAVKAD